ncbi:MAG TPA: ATP-binding cassette domain-containing protein, partial [Blastocatellia bacterium]|nr:ATP-binding cassette domain-containing protein [Blastocatellia bacterium]
MSSEHWPALSVEKVEKKYSVDQPSGQRASGQQGVAALRGVSFEVSRGSFVALRGPSGCGKSTLLHLAGAMDRPTAGIISVGGLALATLNDD